MKYTTKIFILLLSMGVILQTSCIKEKYTDPTQVVPDANLTANITIAQLNSNFSGTLTPLYIGDTLILPSTSDTIVNPVIQGIVNSTDESGNIYKTLYIQDNTGGIQLAVDRTSLYINFKVGQRVYVKLSGIYIGTYGGVVQLGYIYGTTMGRLPDVLIDKHVIKDSLPGPAPVPLERTVSSVSGNDINMLVVLRKVHFAEVGSVYAETEVTTNRTILDSLGNSIILRNSGYANFRANLLPVGQGDLVGILSSYNGDMQFYIRNLNDLINWDANVIFPSNIIEENFDVSPANWTTYSVASNKNWSWSSQYQCMVANGFGGDVASEDWLISPVINLTNVTEPFLSFRTWTKFADSGLPNPLEVFISTDFSGNVQTATWIPLSGVFAPSNSQTWTASGDIDLSAYQNNVYIGFKYRSSGTGSGTTSSWEVDAFKITGLQH